MRNVPELLRTALAAAVLAIPAFAARADINLSNAPLFLSTSVTPNVMLLFDNSGSMDNIMWASGYNPAVTYPDWSRDWDPNDGNVSLKDLSTSGCSGGRYRGRNPPGGGAGSTSKCLLLPDPVGNGNTRYHGNYLNYLFDTYANNTNLTAANTIPQTTRLMVAKTISTDLVNANPTLRWGLARFNPPAGGNSGPGGRVIVNCGAQTSTVTGNSGIAGLTANSNTPLAETFYEITRYFRGLSSYYNSNVNYTSPIQYRCQKNFVVVVTDGFPTYDNTFPTNDPDDVADGTRSLPNWDNTTGSPTTTASMYPIFPRYSDGFQPSGSEASEAYTLYLDDLAKFGYDIDLRKGGTDATGTSFDDPAFRFQRLQTYTVGLALDNQMLKDAAEYGRGRSYTANTSEQLVAALQSALSDIAGQTSAAASVATNSTQLTDGTAIYQARFSTGDWTGELRALPVRLGEDVEPLWDAAEEMPAAGDRRIFTYNGSAGRRFEWNQLNGTQQTALRDGGTVTLGQQRLNYLRGDRTYEAANSTPQFRARNTVLGDIVNSDPAYVSREDYGFKDLHADYASFLSSKASRPAVVYVGANDGMLHAFRASDGVELFAYVPNLIFGKLAALTAPSYNQNHQYYVDGSPRAFDARIGSGANAWRTVLLGALGGGGRGVFALDVTDPVNFGQNDVLWELGAAQDADMGHSYPQPTIARLADGSWAAIVANGYNSGSGKAVLFVLNLATGAVIRKFDTQVAGDNGLSSPIPVDLDGDRITDLVYAGDLKGNLWKFDLRSANPAEWKIAFDEGGSPRPLYTACSAAPCTASNRQPITARPEVGRRSEDADEGVVVYFGTGRYFAVGDNTASGGTNSFYGIFDTDDHTATGSGTSSGIGGRGDLLQQRVLTTETRSFGNNTEDVRITTDNLLEDHHKGWYIDLPAPGERQVSTPILRGGRIIFTTLIPNTDACGFGGSSFLMEIDAISGSRLSDTPFDLNGDFEFDQQDYATVTIDGVTITVPVSGRRSKEGIIKTPVILSAGSFEVKLASGTTGGIDTTIEPPPGGPAGSRLSWRQMQ